MSTTPHILVSGGGIAGNAVAIQLLRKGIRTTVVERAEAPRPGGQAVDLRGPSREVAERMGLMPGITKYQLDERGLAMLDSRGRDYVRMPTEMFGGKGIVADLEITRGDLNAVLLTELATVDGPLDYRYGDSIRTLTQDDTGVEVTFTSGATGRFDLVIGADGVHSATRALAFGPEQNYVTYLGGYGAFFTIPTPADTEPGWMKMMQIPRATLGLRPDADPATSKAMITLRTAADPALRRDIAAQQRLVAEMLSGAGWIAPQVLRAMGDCPDFYFDELARVDMPSLSAGRVTLVGDAGCSGSPMTGMGTAMALVGAYVLAGEIATTPDDLPGALARYETVVTPYLDKAKEIPGGGIRMIVPASRWAIRLALLNMRIMTTRPMRPLMMKFFTHTDFFEVPGY